jgi:hypothetical protein
MDKGMGMSMSILKEGVGIGWRGVRVMCPGQISSIGTIVYAIDDFDIPARLECSVFVVWQRKERKVQCGRCKQAWSVRTDSVVTPIVASIMARLSPKDCCAH